MVSSQLGGLRALVGTRYNNYNYYYYYYYYYYYCLSIFFFFLPLMPMSLDSVAISAYIIEREWYIGIITHT